MNELKFSHLRRANMLRLPQFRDSHGKLAHEREDGSDWSPAEWFCAVLGELGETAEVRNAYESGKIGRDEFIEKMKKEIADVQIYLDLFAMRSLDAVDYTAGADLLSHAQLLMQLIEFIGSYANELKKFRRGDHTDVAQFRAATSHNIAAALQPLRNLEKAPLIKHHRSNHVLSTSTQGVDLGEAVVEKFNAVSDRVKCRVKLDGVAGLWLDEQPGAAA